MNPFQHVLNAFDLYKRELMLLTDEQRAAEAVRLYVEMAKILGPSDAGHRWRSAPLNGGEG